MCNTGTRPFPADIANNGHGRPRTVAVVWIADSDPPSATAAFRERSRDQMELSDWFGCRKAILYCSHVQRTVSRCFATLRHLRTIRRQVPTTVFQSLVIALVLPHLDYCNSVLYGLLTSMIRRLQCVQNAAARLILGINVKNLFDLLLSVRVMTNDLH